MTEPSIQKYWHKLFEYSIFIKCFTGIWETISGFLVLFLSKTTLTNWFLPIAHNELLEDPNDMLMNFLMHALQNFSNDAKAFAAIYILLHGFLNIFLAIQLYRDRHWAYPAAIGTMLVFMFYQIYRIYAYHSLVLVAITIFDAFFVVLIWHEYKYHKEIVQVQAKI